MHSHHQPSARNLLHYLALRSHDLRPLQAQLTAVGLSSLGRAESHVLAAVESVLQVLERLSGEGLDLAFAASERVDLAAGQQLLDAHTEAVLGRPTARGVAIAVTMPGEAADDYTLVNRLLQEGMDCMRINCAHDGPDQWARMIEHLRRAEDRHHRSCRADGPGGAQGPHRRSGWGQPLSNSGRSAASGQVLNRRVCGCLRKGATHPHSSRRVAAHAGAGCRTWCAATLRFVADVCVPHASRCGCWCRGLLGQSTRPAMSPGTLLRVERGHKMDDDASVLEAHVRALPTRCRSRWSLATS